jgi:hypothetical protein
MVGRTVFDAGAREDREGPGVHHVGPQAHVRTDPARQSEAVWSGPAECSQHASHRSDVVDGPASATV